MSKLIVALKIIYVITLLSLFTYFFGLQSFNLYSEHRMMFTDEMIDFRQDKPPAILVAHTPALKPKNYDIVGSCLEGNKYEEKGYEKAVKCIDKNLKSKTELFEADNTTTEYIENQTTVIGRIVKFKCHETYKCCVIGLSLQIPYGTSNLTRDGGLGKNIFSRSTNFCLKKLYISPLKIKKCGLKYLIQNSILTLISL